VPRWELSARTAVIAVGGSARAVLKITRDRLTVERLRRLAAEITEYRSAVLARQYGLAPERARVLPAAVTTLGAILDHFGTRELTVARGGVREGAILSLADEAPNGSKINRSGTRRS
jgi:exopolyphosphatase / guanosine-5'-triphosphate,3'-diphosphate pyrophosphatase